MIAAGICSLCLFSNARGTTSPVGHVQGAHVDGGATFQLQAVPEPQTWVIAFAGLGTLIAMQRFRRTRGTTKR